MKDDGWKDERMKNKIWNMKDGGWINKDGGRMKDESRINRWKIKDGWRINQWNM